MSSNKLDLTSDTEEYLSNVDLCVTSDRVFHFSLFYCMNI